MTTFERQQLISAITTTIETVFDGEDKSEIREDKPTEMLTIRGVFAAARFLAWAKRIDRSALS